MNESSYRPARALGSDPVAVKPYQNPATPIPLRVVCGCIHATTAELSSWDSDLSAHIIHDIYYLVYRKLLLTSVVKGRYESPQFNGYHTADAQYKLLPSCSLRKVIPIERTRKCAPYFMTLNCKEQGSFPPQAVKDAVLLEKNWSQNQKTEEEHLDDARTLYLYPTEDLEYRS